MLLQAFAIVAFGPFAVSALGLDATTIAKVRSKMLSIVSQSWEYGTATEALLELEEPDVSVYGENPFPPQRTLSADSPVITLAEYVLSIKRPYTLPLMNDSSAGDPASMGVAVLLANQTLQNVTYAQAAAQELEFLLSDVPRAWNGAISHRVAEPQLWDDFIYMVPPFIAYYGAISNNITLLREAKNQIGLYREILRDTNSSVTTLWEHIRLGSWNDTSHWGTGNAWAAAGATRVLQTLAKSPYHQELQDDMWELVGWITEILTASWVWQKPGSCLPDHPDLHDFEDCAWTTLLAAATYRLAVLTGDETMIGNAEQAFDYIATQISDDGTLIKVVSPSNWTAPATQSPEAQAFVLLLQAAWRDYIAWKEFGGAPILKGVFLENLGIGAAPPRCLSRAVCAVALLMTTIFLDPFS